MLGKDGETAGEHCVHDVALWSLCRFAQVKESNTSCESQSIESIQFYDEFFQDEFQVNLWITFINTISFYTVH